MLFAKECLAILSGVEKSPVCKVLHCQHRLFKFAPTQSLDILLPLARKETRNLRVINELKLGNMAPGYD